MINAISAWLGGMNDAVSRFNRASQNLLEGTSGASDADPVAAIVDQMQAKVQFKASAVTLRAADEMMSSLLDIIV